MAKFAHKNVLDFGLNYIKDNANILFLVDTYTLGNDYSTVENNQMASIFLNDTDFTITDGAGASRILITTPGRTVQLLKPGVSGGVNMHFAFCNSAIDEVIWVTEESSDVLISYGSILTIPSLSYTKAQPV